MHNPLSLSCTLLTLHKLFYLISNLITTLKQNSLRKQGCGLSVKTQSPHIPWVVSSRFYKKKKNQDNHGHKVLVFLH